MQPPTTSNIQGMAAPVGGVAIVLSLLGLDFEFVHDDLRTGTHKQPSPPSPDSSSSSPGSGNSINFEADFMLICLLLLLLLLLLLQPFGQIPTLQDGDGDLLPTPSAKLEVWLEVDSHHFYTPMHTLVYELPILGAPIDAAEAEKSTDNLAKLLDVYRRTSPSSRTR